MRRIVMFADVHLREKEPFFTATRKALTEILCLLQPGDTVLCAGDFFDKSTLTGKLAATAQWFWNEVHSRTGNPGVCLTGNHDMSTKYGNALRMFHGYAETDSSLSLLKVIEEPSTAVIGEWTVGLLPHQYGSRMKDEYPGILAQWEQDGIDLVVGHFSADPLFGDEVDVSAYQHGPIFLGHIHTSAKNRYIGPTTPATYAERDVEPRVLILDKDGLDTCPLTRQLHYIEVVYGEKLPAGCDQCIVTVTGAPSVRAAREMYPQSVIREVRVVDLGVDGEAAPADIGRTSFREMMAEFKKTLASTSVADKLQKVLGNRA